MPAEDPPRPPASRRGPRFRWLTLAEVVGILALVVAALGWWDNHREHQDEERDRAAGVRSQAAQAKEAALRQTDQCARRSEFDQTGDSGLGERFHAKVPAHR